MARFVPVEAEEEESGPPASVVFGERALRTLADNVLALPGSIGRVMEPVTKAAGIPAPNERSNIAPTTGDFAAGIRAIPGLLTGDQGALLQEQERQAVADDAFRQGSPAIASMGEVAGDIGGLLALRRPAAKRIRQVEDALVGRQVTLPLRPGARVILESAINSPAARSLARGAGRSLETGVDAAILSVLQGEDPTEIAAYAAGSQLGGSAILGGTKSLFTGGPLKAGAKLTLAAGATMGVIQVMKSATPGGQDRILESIETGFDKVKWALFLGAASGIAGAGRLRSGEITRTLPRLSDAISTMPRATVISLANEWRSASSEDQQRMERVLQLQAQNPEIFGPEATRKIQKATEDSKTSLVETINSLSKNKAFREKLDAPEQERRRARFVPVR